MPFGDSSRSRIAFIAESSFGVTPTTPTLIEFRRTGGALEADKQTAVSQQVSLIRDIRGELMVGMAVNGTIPFELSNANFDPILEAVFCGTWATNVLKDGNTYRSHTFEETIPVGGTSHYYRFLGVGMNTLELSINAQSIVTASVGLIGKQPSVGATSIITGATYTAPNNEGVFTADKVASLSILGASPIVTALTINVNNNMRPRNAVGSLYSDEFGYGAFEVTGRIEAYFASAALADAVINHTTGAISFTVGVDANKKYTVSLPVVQITNGRIVLNGQNDDVMVELDFRAVYDTNTSTSIQVTRLVA